MGIGSLEELNRPYCCGCGEQFPVAQEPAGWAMGQLRLAACLERAFRGKYGILTHDPDTRKALYFCGNCYFDLTDE